MQLKNGTQTLTKTIAKCLCGKNRMQGRRKCYQCILAGEREKKLQRLQLRQERKLKTKKYQESEFKKWHKKAWDAQSQYIRKSRASFQDLVQCFTCPAQIPWKEAQLGHFHHGKGDFEKNNLRIQCIQCNYFRSGAGAIYATRLVQEIGQEGLVELERIVNAKTYTVEDFKEIFTRYSELIKSL